MFRALGCLVLIALAIFVFGVLLIPFGILLLIF